MLFCFQLFSNISNYLNNIANYYYMKKYKYISIIYHHLKSEFKSDICNLEK